jgi:hypothetical protein
MKRLMVSLLVESPSLSLDELSTALGRKHSSGSHDRGEPHVLEKKGHPPWSKTVWRFDSGLSEEASVVEHLERLNSQLPGRELLRLLPTGCTVWIDIAVFFDTPMGSVSIPTRGMEVIGAYKAALEITSYPSWKKEP